uniref:Uncharacterized protein n=1 Tax=Anopheles culicifacies TaxID=139723 RepID=A0A182MG08_9DIPT
MEKINYDSPQSNPWGHVQELACNDRISGDESDASRGLPVNLEVPPGLQVVPMSKHHDHGPADFSLPTSLHHHLLPTADDVRERLKLQSAEQFLLQMARLQRPPPPDLDIQTGSVMALKTIPKGTQYGPFVGKLLREPMDRRFAWEVSVHLNTFFRFPSRLVHGESNAILTHH